MSASRAAIRGIVASGKSRSGGGGTPPPADPNLVTRNDMPFDIPQRSVLAAGPKVFAHYFLTFPVAYTALQNSVNGSDVDTRFAADGTPNSTANYYWRWNPGGNVNTETEGWLRDKPLFKRAPRAAITSPTLAGKTLDFRIQDKITECRQALLAGLDGFTIDLLDVPQNAGQYNLTVADKPDETGGAPLRWRQTVELYEAAAEVNRQEGAGTITICLMPDGSTDGTKAPASLLVDAIDWLDDNYPGVNWRYNGKLVVAPYQPEVAPSYDNSTPGASPTTVPAYWKGVLDGLVAKGHSTYFWPCYSRSWTADPQHPLIAHLTQGISRWGSRDPSTSKLEDKDNRQMYAHIKANYPGNTFMAPVSAGDSRPNQGNYFESNHQSNVDETWITAIGDGTSLHVKADAVQIPTWNDYAEGAQVAPSDANGWAVLDHSFWWMVKYKTGSFPVIVRDAIYLSHRLQPTDDAATITYTGRQTNFMTKRSGGTANQNTVRVVSYLTAPADITITIGGRDVLFTNVPAGREIRTTALLPLGDGLISATATRSGTTIASVPSSAARKVSTTRVAQNMQYQFAKSLPDPTYTP